MLSTDKFNPAGNIENCSALFVFRVFFPAAVFSCFLLSASFARADVLENPFARLEVRNRYRFDLADPFRSCLRLDDESGDGFVASDNAQDVIWLSSSGKINLTDSDNGERIWSADLGGAAASNIAINESGVFILIKNADGYFLKNIGRKTGVTAWQKRVSLPTSANADSANTDEENEENVADVSLQIVEDRIALIDKRGEFYAFAVVEGQMLWNTQIEKTLTSKTAFADGKIFAADDSGQTYEISVSDGKKNVVYNSSGRITTIAAESPGKVFFGTENGEVLYMNPRDGRVFWKTRIGGARISDVEATPCGLLVSSFDNFIYLLSSNKGKRIWKKRLSGRVAAKPSAFDGYAVVNSLFSTNALIIELKTGKVVNRLTLEENNFFSGGIFLSERRIIAPTLKGLTVFSRSCP